MARPAGSRIDGLLRAALAVAGAPCGLVVRGDGSVAARAGDPPAGAAEDALARFALGEAPAPGRLKPLAVAIPRTGSEPLATLVLVGPRPVKRAAGLDDLARLIGEELQDREVGGDALFAEIDHRVKNVLATVQSMASQSARRAASMEGFLKAFNGRLKAMASAQELLTATRWRGASINDLATAVLSALAPGQIRWEGPELLLAPRAANTVTLALHELAVNAARYGALTTETGRVDLRWRRNDDDGFELDWIESGGPPVSAPARRGFGTVVMEDVTGRELGGQSSVQFRTGGVRAHIAGSAAALAQPDAALAPTPARPGPQVSRGASSGPRRPAPDIRGLRVIIVEDAILLAMELETGLADAGVEIVGSAGELDQAMRMLDRQIDAAVLDCNLNGVSVEPVAEALAARGVPFLFATGYGENRGAPEGFDAPIIRKPYDVGQIAAALAELVGRG